MSVLDELGQLSAAEEFFVFLDVPYDATSCRSRAPYSPPHGQYLKGVRSTGL